MYCGGVEDVLAFGLGHPLQAGNDECSLRGVVRVVDEGMEQGRPRRGAAAPVVDELPEIIPDVLLDQHPLGGLKLSHVARIVAVRYLGHPGQLGLDRQDEVEALGVAHFVVVVADPVGLVVFRQLQLAQILRAGEFAERFHDHSLVVSGSLAREDALVDHLSSTANEWPRIEACCVLVALGVTGEQVSCVNSGHLEVVSLMLSMLLLLFLEL